MESFPANRRMHLGVSSRCRACHREATRDWRERNRDEINEARRAEYRAEHPLPERPCVVCGKPMQKRPDALVCSPSCRVERKRAQGPRARSAAEGRRLVKLERLNGLESGVLGRRSCGSCGPLQVMLDSAHAVPY